MTGFLYQDTETFSPVPIGHGTHAYAAQVEIMLFAYAWNDDDVTVVDLTAGEKIPPAVLKAQTDPRVVKVFHNSAFDRTVIRHALGIDIPTEQIHDTMVQALTHGLPGSLDRLCEIYGLADEEGKDKAGKQLINLFCKPRPKNHKLRRATRHSHPPEWRAFKKYAGQDIVAMRILHRKMPKWNFKALDDGSNLRQGDEKFLWELDQKINDRGFAVDVELARAALTAAESRKKTLAKRVRKLTREEVQSATQRDRLLTHIVESYGVTLIDLRKSTIERRLEDPDLPEEVKELLRIRLKASATSVGKYKKLLEAVSEDGRLRGTLQFSGASRTRRWAGRLFQPQNLLRPTHEQHEIEQTIEDLKDGSAEVLYDDLMERIGSCVRGVIVAPPGKKLCAADLSNIEGRFAAWVTEEADKVRAFVEYDEGLGPDLYVRAYANMFGVDPEAVQSSERQIGKVTELMLGYGGGVGAFLTGALTYNIDLDALAETAWPGIPFNIQQEAYGFLDWTKQNRRSTFGLDDTTFMTCEALKRMWRNAHPQISSFWPEIEKAARSAILNRGRVYTCRKVQVVCKGAWLRVIMPSGHSICYASPRLEGNQISYMGLNHYTRKWTRLKMYGGKFLENICQFGARDVMAWNMPYAEAEGYNIILTVHDELISEAPDTDEYSAAGLSKILASNPDWALDLPLAAGGFEGYRYRKD